MLFDVALDSLAPSKRKIIIGLRDTYDEILRKVIKRGVEAGSFTETEEKLAANMIASMIVRTRVWFHPRKGRSVKDIADYIFRFTVNALGGEPPQR